MARIKFSCPGDFMEELELLRHEERIDRSEVRFTIVDKPSQEQPSFHFIVAVATAIVGPDFLRMEYCCGACHIGTEYLSEKPYWDKGWEIRDEMEERCEKLGLRFRSVGIFEEA